MKAVVFAAVVNSEIKSVSESRQAAEAYAETWHRLNPDEPADVREGVVEFE